MTRIVYLSPGLFDFGGIARYGRYQVRALREIVGEANVHVVSMLGPTGDDLGPDLAVDAIAGGNDARAKVRFLRMAVGAATRGAIFWAAHVHYAPIVATLAAVHGGVPVVNIYGVEIWSGLSRAVRESIRRCFVVSDCYATLHHAEGMGVARPDRSAVIWDPVDVDRFHPGDPDPEVLARYGLDRGGPRIGFLARLSSDARYKGAERLIEAFAEANLPEEATLVIAGSGDYRPALEAQARRRGLSGRCIFPGRIAEADLGDFYRALDAFVLVATKGPGEGEGLPLTPIEAAACGVPIIVGDEDGSREAVIPGETGFVVSPRDQEALVATLRQVVTPEPVNRMATRAAEWSRKAFSYACFSEQHRRLLAAIGG